MRVPASTYRVQLQPGFGFDAARRLVPYLHALGIGDLYLSPILRARSGSTHGYDVTDPGALNPELGSRAEFQALVSALHERGMGLVVDIVPNHMAMSTENAWWMDVLENGLASPFAEFFDIDWRAPGLEGKVLVPVLGRPYGETLERGELGLSLEDGRLVIGYQEQRFPIDPRSYARVLDDGLVELGSRLGTGHPAVKGIGGLVRLSRGVPPRGEGDPGRRALRASRGAALKRRLQELCRAELEARRFVTASVRRWGGPATGERGMERLDRLIGEQAYLLSYWRGAPEEIDYRRFFDITDLVAIRAQDPQVFQATHGLILELIGAGAVTGVRIDHVDGLHDPVGYLRRLQAHAGAALRQGHDGITERTPPFFVVVEKILSRTERLPADWPAAGTTGYEFLNDLIDLFVDAAGAKAMDRIAARFTGSAAPFEDVAREQKRKVMDQLFGGEVASLASRLQRLARQDRMARDLTRSELARALVEVTASLPVYRTYVRGLEASSTDRGIIRRAVRDAAARLPAEAGPSLEFLRRVLTLDLPPRRRADRATAWLAFTMRWQQFTAPVMAKGVEDTAMYVHAPLLARNEVGGGPGEPPLSVEAFHRRNRARLRRAGNGLATTSTHDTKRSEDVRARIAVMAEMPGEWAERLERWSRWNRRHKREVAGHLAPDPTEELILYQTLVGVWPPSGREERGLAGRVQEHMRKVGREAKVHTSWMEPNDGHEAAVERFVASIMSPSSRRFRADLLAFQRTVALHGMVNGLAQVVIKAASPGVPDLYQGTETWSLRLVDPDNRSAPDFDRMGRQLVSIERRRGTDPAVLAADLLERWADGRVKVHVTSSALTLRRANPDLFSRGAYVPIESSGRWRDHVVAFARHRRGEWALAVAPRLTAKLAAGRLPVGADVWGPTSLALPDGAPDRWRDALTGRELEARVRDGMARIPLAGALRVLPVALLTSGRTRTP